MLAAADQQGRQLLDRLLDPQELAEVMELPKQEEVLMLLGSRAIMRREQDRCHLTVSANR